MTRSFFPDIQRLVVTCEHGSNRVPLVYRRIFGRHTRLLHSHHGYDLGALELARRIAERLRCPLYYSTVTRLLVDLNRSVGNRSVFSSISRELPAEERRRLLRRYYDPYRNAVQSAVRGMMNEPGATLHLAVHTFTPILGGTARTADIGILYDPARPNERTLAQAWKQILCQMRRDFQVRRNYPYLGKADGCTTYLRKRHPTHQYLGIELEVNQRFVSSPRGVWRSVQSLIVESLETLLLQPRAR